METESPDRISADNLVRAVGLKKRYSRRRGPSGSFIPVDALDDLSLEIRVGSTLALAGESGAGKSTLARCLALLEAPDAGNIFFDGKEVTLAGGSPRRSFRKDVQLIFQDPSSAMNPRLSAAEIVEEPLHVQGVGLKRLRRSRALELMDQVGLPAGAAGKLALELSGGQRQRLAIARALALGPRFIILDEALAGLDLSIQAQLVNLLLDLQAKQALTYLYITHDLSLVTHLADHVAVMHQGRIVETMPAARLFPAAQHPVTRLLLECIPCGI